MGSRELRAGPITAEQFGLEFGAIPEVCFYCQGEFECVCCVMKVGATEPPTVIRLHDECALLLAHELLGEFVQAIGSAPSHTHN